jgi:hypothetical protein
MKLKALIACAVQRAVGKKPRPRSPRGAMSAPPKPTPRAAPPVAEDPQQALLSPDTMPAVRRDGETRR